jgi:iron-sulfur cluster repair protein YtfE (RIC family)
MPDRVETLREEHVALRDGADRLCEAARAVVELSPAERRAALDEVVSFLRTKVLPHTWIDERVLYPEVAARLGDPLSTASMNYDHLAIRDWVERIADADPDEPARLQELLYGLHALIEVHTWKEDQLYISALGSPSWPSA